MYWAPQNQPSRIFIISKVNFVNENYFNFQLFLLYSNFFFSIQDLSVHQELHLYMCWRLRDKHSLTYAEELIIGVGHAEGSLPIDFSGGGVKVASLGEWREMGNAVRKPETLRTVKEQYPCKTQTNNA